eukprot:m.235101 g.235101  ORF g.235101 m.235101 type:complete len:1667 (-) comp17397_c0_seq3:36-5036(-)
MADRSYQTSRRNYTATPASRRHGTAIPTLQLQKPFAAPKTAAQTSFANESLYTSVLNTSRIPVRSNANASALLTSTLRPGETLQGLTQSNNMQPSLPPIQSELSPPAVEEPLSEELFASTEASLQQISAISETMRSQPGSQYTSPQRSHRDARSAPLESPTQSGSNNSYSEISVPSPRAPIHDPQQSLSPRATVSHVVPALPPHLSQGLSGTSPNDSFTSLGSNLPGLTDDLSYLLSESRVDPGAASSDSASAKGMTDEDVRQFEDYITQEAAADDTMMLPESLFATMDPLYDDDEYIDPVEITHRSATPLASLNGSVVDPTEERPLADVEDNGDNGDNDDNDDNDGNDDINDATSNNPEAVEEDDDIFNANHSVNDSDLITRLERRRSSFQQTSSLSEDNCYDSGTDDDKDSDPVPYHGPPSTEAVAEQSPSVSLSPAKPSGWSAFRKSPNPAAQALVAAQQDKRLELPADRFAVMRRASIVAHLTQHGRRRSAAASFVSRQLHKFLLSRDPETETDEPTSSTSQGAVLFADASGFTQLTQTLTSKHALGDKEGAEELCKILNDFFAKMIAITDTYGGDVVKFSGDAISVVWYVDADEAKRSNDYICDTLEKAALRACACSEHIHMVLDNYVAVSEEKMKQYTRHSTTPGKLPPSLKLRLHMGIGVGQMTAVHVGGVFKRWEYIIGGPPMTQLGVAEPLAKPGETCISPEVHELVAQHCETVRLDQLQEAKPRAGADEHGDYRILLRMTGEVQAPRKPFELNVNDHVKDLMKRYIPKAVHQCIEQSRPFDSEMRPVSVIFVNVTGLSIEVTEDQPAEVVQRRAHRMMLEVQRSMYNSEGSINKLLVDDKGLLVLCAMGLPPMKHSDDPSRALAAALSLASNISSLGDGISARIGVATGRAFCGVIGSPQRREYTMMGAVVNTAARLMGQAKNGEVICCKATARFAQSNSSAQFNFESMGDIKLKGFEKPVAAFKVLRNSGFSFAEAQPLPSTDDSGRAEEADQLEDCLERLESKKGGVLVLTGERGSGKSYLVKQIQNRGLAKRYKVLFVPKSKGHVKQGSVVDQEIHRMTTGDQSEVSMFTDFKPIITQALKEVAKHSATAHSLDIQPQVFHAIAWCIQIVQTRCPQELQHLGLLGRLVPEIRQELQEEVDAVINPQRTDRTDNDTSLSDDTQPARKRSSFATLGELNEAKEHLQEILFNLILAFGDQFPTLVMMHLQTGTALKRNVETETWALALRLSKHMATRASLPSAKPLTVCVVTRNMGDILKKRADDPVRQIWEHAEANNTLFVLQALSEEKRGEYAALQLSLLVKKTITVSALPPELISLLQDRAAGNPKHIKEMLAQLYKHKAIMVADNGRIEIKQDLYRVPVPEKIRTLVMQEYDQMDPEYKDVLNAAAVYKHGFTPAMVAFVQDNSSDKNIEHVKQVLSELMGIGTVKQIRTTPTVLSNYPRDISRTCYAFVSKLLQEVILDVGLTEKRKSFKTKISTNTNRVRTAVLAIQRFLRSCRMNKRTPSVGRSLLDLYSHVKRPDHDDSDNDDFGMRNPSEGDLSSLRDERRSSDQSNDMPRLRRSSALDSVQSALEAVQSYEGVPGLSSPRESNTPVVTVTDVRASPVPRRQRVLAPARDFVAKRRLQDGTIVTSRVVRNIGRQAPVLHFNPTSLLQ